MDASTYIIVSPDSGVQLDYRKDSFDSLPIVGYTISNISDDIAITIDLRWASAISVTPQHFLLPPRSQKSVSVHFDRAVINHFDEGLNEIDFFFQATLIQATTTITDGPVTSIPAPIYASPVIGEPLPPSYSAPIPLPPSYVSPVYVPPAYVPSDYLPPAYVPPPEPGVPYVPPTAPSAPLETPTGAWKEERFNGAPFTPSSTTDVGNIFAQGPYSTTYVNNVYYQNTIPAPTTIRWTGNFLFTAEEYQFMVVADDGVRVWLDNELIFDSWQLQPYGFTATRRIVMSARYFNFRVEYFNGDASSSVNFQWFLVGVSPVENVPLPGPVVTDPMITFPIPLDPPIDTTPQPTWRNGVTRQTLYGYPPTGWYDDGSGWWYPPVNPTINFDFNYTSQGGQYNRSITGSSNKALGSFVITVDGSTVSDWTYEWDFGGTYTFNGGITTPSVTWILTPDDLAVIDSGQSPMRTVTLTAFRGTEFQTKVNQVYLYDIVVTNATPTSGGTTGGTTGGSGRASLPLIE